MALLTFPLSYALEQVTVEICQTVPCTRRSHSKHDMKCPEFIVLEGFKWECQG